MLTRYDHYKFEECEEELPSFMQLLKHVVEHHNEEQYNKSEMYRWSEIREIMGKKYKLEKILLLFL